MNSLTYPHKNYIRLEMKNGVHLRQSYRDLLNEQLEKLNLNMMTANPLIMSKMPFRN
jgi:hypothetical protein